MKIIEASEEHIPQIIKLWKEFMEFHEDLDDMFAASVEARSHYEQFLYEAIHSPDRTVLIATQNSDLVGYTLLSINHYPPTFCHRRFGYIYDMAVKSTERRKGAGSALLEAAEKWFRNHRLDRMELRVVSKNTPGCSFWKKKGFDILGYCMRKSLPEDSGEEKQTKASSQGCVFCCKLENREIILENETAFAVEDGFPVTRGHTLILPHRHEPDYFFLSQKEREDIHALMEIRREQLLKSDPSIKGFNMGVNCGEAAGQSIFHCHVHLIPRRKGDAQNPRGGVRGVIPGRMDY